MSGKDDHQSWLSAARTAMAIEAEAIALASGRLNQGFCRAVELILAGTGKLVVIGIGKSGHVGRKIVATLRSTGTPAAFLHAAEAVHGDLGIYAPGDLTLIVSKSGTTLELLSLLPKLRELGSGLIGILGNPDSPLAAAMDAVLDASVQREADPNNLAPTASAVVALALGHALAIALMEARGFTADDFHRSHPGGQLGRYLLRVRDVMHGESEIAWAGEDHPLKQVVIAMTRWPLGSACVTDPERRLLGLITDGDLRRALQTHDDIRTLRAADVMTRCPVTIGPDERLWRAIELMEDRASQISVLPVVAADQRTLGLIRLHDIYQNRQNHPRTRQ